MVYDKLRYEKLIAESDLFCLDKETEASAYKRESYKMLEYIYCYLMAINEKGYEPFACEIMDVATRCINNYESSKGTFLHYFNAAWKKEYSHLMGNQIIEDRLEGLKITEEEKRNIRKFIRLAESKEVGISNDELYHNIAEVMELPVEKVRLIAELSTLHIIGDTKQNAEGEEISVWDQIADDASTEDKLTEMASIEDLLSKVDTVFASLQARQKPIVSDMITARIWSMLSEKQENTYSFISRDVMEICKMTGQELTQRAIAEKYGRDEASISRTVKEFINKLKTFI